MTRSGLRLLFLLLFSVTLLGCRLIAQDAPTPTVQATATLLPSATAGVAASATAEPEITPTLAQAPVATATATTAAPAQPTATATVSQPQGVDRRLSFAAGETSAAVENAVVRGTQDRYVLGAQAGQTMQVQITSLEDNAAFLVYGPDGQALKDESEETVMEWAHVLPETGDYEIVVVPVRGNATYRLVVTIPPLVEAEATRIQFAPDMTATMIEGRLEAGERALYVLSAAEEQDMSVSVSSEGDRATVGVYGEDGTVFLPQSATQTGLHIAALPASMDYFVEVVAADTAVDYILVVGVSALADLPERIRFEPGATSATVSGTLQAGGDLDRYILSAAEGQRITIDALPPDAPLSVYLQSEDSVDFFFATEGQLVAELPRTLDYVLSVSTPNAAGMVDYELHIAIE